MSTEKDSVIILIIITAIMITISLFPSSSSRISDYLGV